MNRETLQLLAETIFDTGYWYCWNIQDDIIQLEFCNVQLYDESRAEKDIHTTDVLAVRFSGHTFAVFADRRQEDGWHTHFQEDDSILYPVDEFYMGFDDMEKAQFILNWYEQKTSIKDYNGLETLASAKHFMYASCGDVCFIVGGDEISVIGRNGAYSEEDIQKASDKWMEYWRTYWKLKGTADAYPRDFACEVNIPFSWEL
ncbi:MAG: hypothetical protein IKS37_06110 [Solobacterium sp.]|nr:hypothetical protein [Solobacterium sp.]